MNTRLQVEHPVTELITGIDLVEWQIRIAEGEGLPWSQTDITPRGHAIEARLYAEDPADDFRPAIGEILMWRPPTGQGVRVDDAIRAGDQVTADYDPLLAKIIAHGDTRAGALRRLRHALADTVLFGLTTNLAYLRAILEQPAFADPGSLSTRFLEEHLADWPPAITPQERAVALTAVTLAQWHRLSAGGPGYWRNNPGEPAPFRYRLGAKTVEVRLRPTPHATGRYDILLPDDPTPHPLTVEAPDNIPPLNPSRVSHPLSTVDFTLDGLRRHVFVATAGDEYWAQTAVASLRFKALPLLPEPKHAAGPGGTLRAPLPGTLLAVLVEVGQRVAAGQPLAKIEAMKMEHTIRATEPGLVAAIYFAPGDRVRMDDLLFRIDPA
jgi:acetyl/propionyl-CoA carboxylase alpha subunit